MSSGVSGSYIDFEMLVKGGLSASHVSSFEVLHIYIYTFMYICASALYNST
jgi:hypothetical protein